MTYHLRWQFYSDTLANPTKHVQGAVWFKPSLRHATTLAATAHSKLFGSLHSTATLFCMQFSVASVAELCSPQFVARAPWRWQVVAVNQITSKCLENKDT